MVLVNDLLAECHTNQSDIVNDLVETCDIATVQEILALNDLEPTFFAKVIDRIFYKAIYANQQPIVRLLHNSRINAYNCFAMRLATHLGHLDILEILYPERRIAYDPAMTTYCVIELESIPLAVALCDRRVFLVKIRDSYYTLRRDILHEEAEFVDLCCVGSYRVYRQHLILLLASYNILELEKTESMYVMHGVKFL
jgi:hypothetical protein